MEEQQNLDNVGNTRQAATDLGTFPQPQTTFSDWIGNGDYSDYFKFDLTGNSDVSFQVTDLNAGGSYAYLYVYPEGSTSPLGYSIFNGNNDRPVDLTLAPASYYALVQSYSSSSSPYTLEVAATEIADTAGNTLGTARNLGVLTGEHSFTDWIGSLDQKDYYSFDLEKDSALTFDLSEFASSSYLYLYLYEEDSNSQVGYRTFSGTSTSSPLDIDLKSGSYYALVQSYSTTSPYKLAVSATEIVETAGNTQETARDLGNLTGEHSFTDWIGSLDQKDYYKFTLEKDNALTFDLSEFGSSYLYLYLYEEGSNSSINSQYFSGSSTSSPLDVNLTAGTYYAEVRSSYYSRTNTPYTLDVEATELPEEAGNTRETAKDIGSLTGEKTFQDWVGDIDREDYYFFALPENSTVTLNLSELTSNSSYYNAYIYLYEEGSTSIVTSKSFRGTDQDTAIDKNLKAGNYYARVTPYYSSTNTHYTLDMSATQIPDRAGNTRETAKEIDVFSPETTFSDWVGDIDRDDYYKFELAENSNLRFNLSGMLAGDSYYNDAYLYIYQEGSTSAIASGTFRGTSQDTALNVNLDGGTYYAWVAPYYSYSTSNVPYTLEISATDNADGAGNTRETAKEIDDILTGGEKTFQDWVGNGDTQDYYKFSLAVNSNLTFSLSDLAQNNSGAYLYLYEEGSNSAVNSRLFYGNNGGELNVNLDPGTYYAEVKRYSSSNTPYTLKVLGTENTDGAGNTPETAKEIDDILTGEKTFQDWVGHADTKDYYKFDLPGSSNLTFSLSDLSGSSSYYEAYINIYAEGSTSSIASRYFRGTEADTPLNVGLNGGTYYALVSPYYSSNSTSYTLAVSGTEISEDAGNTRETATEIDDILTGEKRFQDWVGTADRDDYYKFDLAENSSLTFNLSDLSASTYYSAYIYLYQEGSTSSIASKSFRATEEETALEVNLQAGTYYAQVKPYYSSNTPYTLEVSGTEIPDGAGNTRETAKEISDITTGEKTFQDWVGDIDREDYYKFDLVENSSLTFNLSDLSASSYYSAYIYIYKEGSTSSIASRSFRGTEADTPLEANLQAGTYYAQVKPYYSSSNTPYTLEVSGTEIPDGAGNTRETAKDIGTLTGENTFQDWVGTIDRDDYYKFDLETSSTIDLNLSDVSADAGAYVYVYQEDSNSTVAYHRFRGTSEDTALNFKLGAGTYYARVYPYYSSSNTPYTLELAATEIADGAGNTRETAKDIGRLTGEKTFRDSVGTVDSDDYYKFDLAENSTINLNLSDLSDNGSAYVYVYQEDSNSTVTSSVFWGTDSDKPLNFNLQAGTYYARVSPYYNRDTNYTLEFFATEIPDGAGNSKDTAKEIGILAGERSFSDWIGRVDTLDYYKFDLRENSILSFDLSDLSGSAYVRIYDEDSSWNLSSRYFGGTTSDTPLNYSLNAGTYYVAVTNYYSSDTPYSLDVSVTEIADRAGNTRERARDIGVLNGENSFSDWVGTIDRDDYYSFALTSDSSLEFNLSDLESGTYLYIYEAGSNRTVSSRYFRGTSSDSPLEFKLAAGNYFARVNGYSNTPYNLEMSAVEIVDRAGDTFNAARNLNILQGTRSFQDFVGNIDSQDYYRFELLQNSSFELTLEESESNAGVRVTLYDGDGDWMASQTGSWWNDTALSLSRELEAGNYFIQVSRSWGETDYSLELTATPEVTVLPLEITDISPESGSNSGQTTITLAGSQFTPDSQISLVDGAGSETTASQVTWQNDSTLMATFDLEGLTPGDYDVVVAGSAGTATADESFAVNSGPQGELAVTLSVPSRVRPWWQGDVIINYRNTGNGDIPAPLLSLVAEGAQMQDPFTGEWTSDTVQFLGINNQGLAGVLPPGARGSFRVRVRPEVAINELMTFTVNTVAADEDVDWDGFKQQLRPEDISDEAWDRVWDNFVSSLGETAADYQQILAENATALSQLGEYSADVSRLLGFELQQASNFDALTSGYSLGSLGRGWPFIGDLVAVTDADGNVSIQNGDSRRVFSLLTDGSFAAADHGATLTAVGDGYQLREADGTIAAFHGNGRLNYIEDTNGNRTEAVYQADRLTSLTNTNGDRLDFTYNGEGRIIEAADDAGRTTTYGYDDTGEKLLTVTTSAGETRYSYNDDFAVTSITYPDGTSTQFEYDDRGRLTRESWGNGSEGVTYSYDDRGGVKIADGNGATTELLLNDRGQVGRVVDPLGRQTQYRYDEAGNLTQILAPDGSITGFIYDDFGNVVSQLGADGSEIEFAYDPNFNQLQQVTDARGNGIEYHYDERGNTTAIVYADGSRDRFKYDERGNSIEWANRRDERIIYTYDESDRVASKQLPSGTTIDYEYDSRGNILSATTADGESTVMEYDGADRLTKITYPTGRWLQFSYDENGRRTQMLDRDGTTVNYSYDEAGRLQELTDGNDRLIVGYSYDGAGRLVRESNGNGTYTTYAYDDAGQLVTLANMTATDEVNSRFEYSYDQLGRQTGKNTLDGEWQYSYDAVGQLTRGVFNSTNPAVPHQDLSYVYDGAGNRVQAISNGEDTSYQTNNLNQYSSAGDISYEYDADGNLIEKVQGGEVWQYSYDGENRLVEVVEPDGTTTEYEYNVFGDRVATVYDGQRTEYLVDPFGFGDVVGEYDGEGNLVARYNHGWGLVSRADENGTTAYYDFNAIGSTVGLSGSDGDYLNQYSYLPFGGSLSERETVTNPFEFVGQFGVMEENNGLDFMRARFYDSETGRFVSDDPLGLQGGDTNIRRYAFNNPVSNIDPLGLGYFASRPLGGFLGNLYVPSLPGFQPGDNPIYDFFNTEISHEQYFFDDGTNIGFFDDGTVKPDNRDLLDTYDPNTRSENFDDNLIRQAIQNVELENYLVIPIWPNTDNCQSWAERVRKEYERLTEKPEDIPTNPADQGQTPIIRSYDPNDIIGPAGVGEENWISPEQRLPYTIRFENDAEKATAPAVFVTITQQLDSDLDWNSFEVGDFGFGDIYIEVPEGFQTYSERVDLRDSIGYFVDFNAAIDPDSGEATWTLETIEPETGEYPNDFDAGFLPPNREKPEGEGFVNYRIQTKTGITTDTVIDAEAEIVFDTNEPIDTPAIFNTIDITPPTSTVEELPETVSSPEFTVKWQGDDRGSGIATYDIYVSVEDGPFELWLDDTSETESTYRGEVGKTYAFYSVAIDRLGYKEEIPTLAQARTTMIEENVAPEPSDDAISTDADTPVTISSSELLANDQDEDVDTLSITSVSNAVNGTVELNAEGEIVFTPDAEFIGEASFSYTVRDSEGEENSATVTVIVNAVNAAPEPSDDEISTNADTPVTIESSQLLANDQDEDVDTLTITQVSNAVNGTVELNAEGEIVFTPDAEFTGEASFDYTVQDSEGEENSATVTVIVNAVNAAPQPEDDAIATNADTPVTISSSELLANDIDEDVDTLTITQVSNAVNGTVELNAEGEIVFTPDAEFTGEATFSYTVRDSEGEENSATVTVTVNAVNAAPEPEDDAISTNADTPVTIESSQLLANDQDEDVDTLTITQVSNAVNGTVELNAEGEILFTPDAEFVGEASFSYTVRDSEGEENSATVTVTVNAVNAAPEPEDDEISTNADTPVTIESSQLLANDQDEDLDTLTITQVSNAVNGTVELNAEGEIVFTPDAEFIGEASFDYTVRDSEGEENSATVTVTVNAVNAAPQPSDDEISTNADTPVTIESSQLLANDRDEDVDTLTITQVSNAVNGTVQLNAEGEILFTPDAEFIGEASFSYTVRDSEGEENSATVIVAVNPIAPGNEINGTPGRDNLTGTPSDDIITGFQGRDTLTGGAGSDRFVYSSILDAGDFITDFEIDSDKIVMTDLLSSLDYAGENPIADGYIQISSRGDSAMLSIDPDGALGGGRSRTFIMIEGTSADAMNENNNWLL